jgi:hypothetical protein
MTNFRNIRLNNGTKNLYIYYLITTEKTKKNHKYIQVDWKHELFMLGKFVCKHSHVTESEIEEET